MPPASICRRMITRGGRQASPGPDMPREAAMPLTCRKSSSRTALTDMTVRSCRKWRHRDGISAWRKTLWENLKARPIPFRSKGRISFCHHPVRCGRPHGQRWRESPQGLDIRCDGDAVLATENGGKVVSVKGSGSGQSVTVEYSRKERQQGAVYLYAPRRSLRQGRGYCQVWAAARKDGRRTSAFRGKKHLCGRHAAGHRPGGVPRRDRPERQHPAAGAAQRQRLARQIQEYGKHQGRKTAHHRRMDEKTALLGGQRRGPVRMQRSCRGDGHDPPSPP